MRRSPNWKARTQRCARRWSNQATLPHANGSGADATVAGGYGTQKRRRGWGWTLLATALIVIGAVLAPVATVASWARVQLTDTNSFVAAYAPLANDPAVQKFVTDATVEVIQQNVDIPGLSAQSHRRHHRSRNGPGRHHRARGVERACRTRHRLADPVDRRHVRRVRRVRAGVAGGAADQPHAIRRHHAERPQCGDRGRLGRVCRHPTGTHHRTRQEGTGRPGADVCFPDPCR